MSQGVVDGDEYTELVAVPLVCTDDVEYGDDEVLGTELLYGDDVLKGEELEYGEDVVGTETLLS